MAETFKALMLTEADGKVGNEVCELSTDALPEGDVLVRVEYSDVNYKDGMVVNGIGGLVRKYPHVPGIDFAGVVAESSHGRYKAGDKVVLTGWRVGEVHWGGYAQMARVNGDWLVPLPEGLSTRQAMAVGTAGLTSMLCVMALEDHGLTPADGPVLVTGAGGGVGSVAVAILARLGYMVGASTGREALQDYLKGRVDTVGSTTLARVLAQIKYGGSVAACGLAGGPKLETTVIPFLLRGVNLLGIDSVMQPFENRVRVWDRIASDLPHDKLEEMTDMIGLEGIAEAASSILSGQVRGRLVVDLSS